MVKCEYCDSIYYRNVEKCSSCGASLPLIEENKVNPIGVCTKTNTNTNSMSSSVPKTKKVEHRKKTTDLKIIFIMAVIFHILLTYGFWSFVYYA